MLKDEKTINTLPSYVDRDPQVTTKCFSRAIEVK